MKKVEDRKYRMGKQCKENIDTYDKDVEEVGGSMSGKMKVTVCFGNVRVIVPCSNPDMLVRDLMQQSILRYKKAVGKSQDSWVVIQKLKSQSDGGILDLDDRLIDVADDREQIMAIFEEDNDGMPSLRHNAGDGTSASSVGTNSPDIFQGAEHKFQPFARTDIEITGEELSGPASVSGGGVTLQVRRGSEPALNRLSPVHFAPPDPSKRWSAAPVIDEDKENPDAQNHVPEPSSAYHAANSVISTASSDNRESSVTSSSTVLFNDNATNNASEMNKATSGTTEHYSKFLRNKSSGHITTNTASRFSRDCNRLSMQFFGDGGAKWVDAADRALWMSMRRDPVGNSPNSEASESHVPISRSKSEERPPYRDIMEPSPTEIILNYEPGPLGIHLIPEHSERGKNQGLIVQNVEKGGRVDRSGCLKTHDKILEINGNSLIGVPFQEAQELFRQGLSSEQLRLTVIKHPMNKETETNEMEKENMVQGQQRVVGDSRVATVSSIKKGPLQSAPVSRNATNVPLIASNTRKIGQKYEIDLQKGPQGLGFSITTRDNPAGGNCPIYIKNILPRGAAIDDGRLKPGDRLLEVNGIEITGKTQAEAVAILKNIPLGGIVKLVVSRQERVDLSPKLPRQIPPEKITDDLQPVPWSEKEILELDIPVLDTEKAGLGISVKGKTASQPDNNGMIDMGIFIKNVIHGGAASRDGRLKSNDQLLSINGVPLLNCSNTQAMEVLRKTMTQDGPKPKPGFITLKIARRIQTSSAPNTDLSGCGSSNSGDEADLWVLKQNTSVSADGSMNEVMLLNNQLSRGASARAMSQSPVRNLPSDDLQHSQRQMQDIINRNRSSSLRRVDALKGRFEGSQSSSPSGVQRPALDLPRNPVLERLTGKNAPNVRNDSYYRATTDTSFSPVQSQSSANGRPGVGEMNSNFSPRRGSGTVVHTVNGDAIIVEDDYSAPLKPPRRSRSNTPENSLDRRMPHSVPPPQVSSPVTVMSEPHLSDVTYASQTSLEVDDAGFSRDAFGRQSMSEKRHATLDAKSTDTYQRNKKLREERERQKQLEAEQHKHIQAQKLAERKNLQDQWARRGVKRPLAIDNDASLDNLPSDEEPSLSPKVPWTTQMSNKVQLSKGKPGDRLGLGDQLLQLLHHWSQKRMSRHDVIGLPRVNSADSLVGSIKMSAPVRAEPRRDRHGKPKDIGPSLGMKKSSSLESLQTMVQEIVIEEDMKSGYVPPRSGAQSVRVVRGRGCNESFRQAVDRSYEAPLNGISHQMDPLAEEETESCLSGPSSGQNVRIDLEDVHEDRNRSIKKKAGLFRGLGSMFRFGRHRKPGTAKSSTTEGEGKYGTTKIDPIQEQYRRLAEKRELRSNVYGSTSSRSNDYADERQLQQIRTSSHYSTGNGSMRVKQPSRAPLEMQGQQDVNGNPVSAAHARSASYDIYNEMTRPGSRVGFVDPKKSSHYLNYDEIKQHLNGLARGNIVNNQRLTDGQIVQMRNTVAEQRKKAILESRRHQQHYHSQRRDNPRERRDRPISNFYEYEYQNPRAQPPPVANNVVHQQQNHRNNNGVTLPSPTVPWSVGSISVKQLPPSQFQAGSSFSQSQLSSTSNNNNEIIYQSSNSHPHRSQQQGHNNSLPRRQHKEPAMNYNQQQSTSQLSTAQYRQTLPPQQVSSSGRYVVTTPQGSYAHVQSQNHLQNQNYQQYASLPQSQSSSVRLPQVNQHHQKKNGVMYPAQSMSVGSKV